jgi:hypothetical protein
LSVERGGTTRGAHLYQGVQPLDFHELHLPAAQVCAVLRRRGPDCSPRVRVEIMGSQTCRIAGKSQSVLTVIDPHRCLALSTAPQWCAGLSARTSRRCSSVSEYACTCCALAGRASPMSRRRSSSISACLDSSIRLRRGGSGGGGGGTMSSAPPREGQSARHHRILRSEKETEDEK